MPTGGVSGVRGVHGRIEARGGEPIGRLRKPGDDNGSGGARRTRRARLRLAQLSSAWLGPVSTHHAIDEFDPVHHGRRRAALQVRDAADVARYDQLRVGGRQLADLLITQAI